MTAPSQVIVGTQALRLGRRIGRGGEGVIFASSEDSTLAVKLYTTPDRASREAKIAAMVRAELSKRAPLVAFPLAIARGRDGSFAGFVMRLVDGHKPLHDLYSPGSRKHHFPQANYRFLVRSATNIARAVASVHQSKCVIGDINHSGILVSPKATVALIDADSFQISEGGESFLCRVGVPEYTPPELQGKPLAGIVRTPNHDAFGLAVVIFQVLFMGRHPFVGTVRRGEIPPLHENIQRFRYVYAENRDVGMDQPPGTPALSDFSTPIAALFDAAFSQATADRRPTAEHWVRHLGALESSLIQCEDNPLHHGPRDASECAWCEMERQVGTFLFLPRFDPTASTYGGIDPGAIGFNVDLVWAKIEAVSLPTPEQLKPRLRVPSVTPRQKAIDAKNAGSGKAPLGLTIAVLAGAALFAAPSLFIIWVPLILWGFMMVSTKPSIDSQAYTSAFLDAEWSWAKELQNWHQRIGLSSLFALKQDLLSARDDYKRLTEEEEQLIVKYRSDRKERHLHAFLDGFDIQHTKISGIGPAKQAILASYGIDTAADVSRSKLLAVPGFGNVTSRGLLEWRATLERRFVYSAQENDADRQEFARIQALVATKAVTLRRKLSVAAQNLEAAVRRIREVAGREDPILFRVQSQREQAKCDLAYLGIPAPQVPPGPIASQAQSNVRWPTPPSPRPVASPPVGHPGGHPSPQSCPRCGSSMVKRLARRGRNAGGYFWGCSRYPRCKGTRNI